MRAAIGFGLYAAAPSLVCADNEEDRMILQDPAGQAEVTVPSGAPAHRLALGFSFIGGQVRWSFTKKWAAEFQFQTGKASSHYGDVRANVFGLRAYRFLKNWRRMAFYAGPEVAYAEATAEEASYKTTGMVIGAFGGFDYYVAKRFSLGIDIGPYLISLKEKQTGLSQTNLDFVVNATLNWHLF
jgi:hypothetical protein